MSQRKLYTLQEKCSGEKLVLNPIGAIQLPELITGRILSLREPLYSLAARQANRGNTLAQIEVRRATPSGGGNEARSRSSRLTRVRHDARSELRGRTTVFHLNAIVWNQLPIAANWMSLPKTTDHARDYWTSVE